jgi:hypothetical protein
MSGPRDDAVKPEPLTGEAQLISAGAFLAAAWPPPSALPPRAARSLERLRAAATAAGQLLRQRQPLQIALVDARRQLLDAAAELEHELGDDCGDQAGELLRAAREVATALPRLGATLLTGRESIAAISP